MDKEREILNLIFQKKFFQRQLRRLLVIGGGSDDASFTVKWAVFAFGNAFNYLCIRVEVQSISSRGHLGLLWRAYAR